MICKWERGSKPSPTKITWEGSRMEGQVLYPTQIILKVKEIGINFVDQPEVKEIINE